MESESPPDPRRLVEAIQGPSPRYKRQEVEAVVARREETTPYLLEILETILRDPESYLAGLGENFDPLYAVMLLAHLREPAAHDLIIDLARLPTQLFEGLLGGFITEGMDRALIATCDGRTARIRELVLDRSADAYLRSQAAEALAMAVHQGFAEREEVLEFLAGQLSPEVAESESYFWTGVGGAMLKLYPVDHLQVFDQAFDEGLIETGMFDRADVEECIASGPEVAAAELAGDVRRALTPDVHGWMGWWACFHDPPVFFAPAAPHRRPSAVSASPQVAAKRAKRAKRHQRAARKKQRRKKKKR